MQELGCFKFPGIVYISLQHGAVYNNNNNNNNNNLLHLYSAFLDTQSALHSKGTISSSTTKVQHPPG